MHAELQPTATIAMVYDDLHIVPAWIELHMADLHQPVRGELVGWHVSLGQMGMLTRSDRDLYLSINESESRLSVLD